MNPVLLKVKYRGISCFSKGTKITLADKTEENIESISIELTEEILEKINIIHNNNPNPAP